MSDTGELLTGHLPDYPKVYNSSSQNANVYNKSSTIKAMPIDARTTKDKEWLEIFKKNVERWKKKKSSATSVKIAADGSIEAKQDKAEESSGSSGNGNAFPPDNVMTHAADAEVTKEERKQDGNIAMKAMETLAKMTDALIAKEERRSDRLENDALHKELKMEISYTAMEKTIESLTKQLEARDKTILHLVNSFENDTKPIELLAIAKFKQFKDTLEEIKSGKKIEDPTIAKKIATFWEDIKPLLGDVAPIALPVISHLAKKFGLGLPDNTETGIVVAK